MVRAAPMRGCQHSSGSEDRPSHTPRRRVCHGWAWRTRCTSPLARNPVSTQRMLPARWNLYLLAFTSRRLGAQSLDLAEPPEVRRRPISPTARNVEFSAMEPATRANTIGLGISRPSADH